MKTSRIAQLVLVLGASLLLSGCGSWMGNLRQDLDDSDPYEHTAPTTGGSWTERGYLDDDPGNHYAAVGHSERNPASATDNGARGRDSWVSDQQQDSNARDRYRENGDEERSEDDPVSFSNSPVNPPEGRQLYKNGTRATRADFIDESPSEGSLWASDGQTNYYFTKNKVRGVGDIVTVTMEDGLVKDTLTEITRTLSVRERRAEVVAAQDRMREKALADAGFGPDGQPKDTVKTSAAAPTRAPAAQATGNKKQNANAQQQPEEEKKTAGDVEIPQAGMKDIDVSKSLDLKAGETILTEITDRYPNGNYKIRGTKKLRYRNGFKIVNLVAVVRGSDIGEDDTVASGKLYEYRLDAMR